MRDDITAALKEWRDAKMELHDYLNETEWRHLISNANKHKKEDFKDHWIRLAEAEWDLYTLAKELE